MSGVVDEHGQQWERCDRCRGWTKFQKLVSMKPCKRWAYGADLCFRCSRMFGQVSHIRKFTGTRRLQER